MSTTSNPAFALPDSDLPPPFIPANVGMPDPFQANIPAQFFETADPRLKPHITICSIYPRDLRSKAYCHGPGIRYYEIAAGTPDSPKYLPIYNNYTNLRGTSQINPDEPPPLIPAPINALQFANNLVQEWGGDHPANRAGFIGIFIIAGDIATPQELARGKANQDNFFKAVISNCDHLWHNGKRDRNWDEGRRAISYLGVDPRLHEWALDLTQALLADCPACANRINTKATVCSHCTTDLISWFEKHGLTPDPKEFPGVAAMSARKKNTQAEKTAQLAREAMSAQPKPGTGITPPPAAGTAR